MAARSGSSARSARDGAWPRISAEVATLARDPRRARRAATVVGVVVGAGPGAGRDRARRVTCPGSSPWPSPRPAEHAPRPRSPASALAALARARSRPTSSWSAPARTAATSPGALSALTRLGVLVNATGVTLGGRRPASSR